MASASERLEYLGHFLFFTGLFWTTPPKRPEIPPKVDGLDPKLDVVLRSPPNLPGYVLNLESKCVQKHPPEEATVLDRNSSLSVWLRMCQHVPDMAPDTTEPAEVRVSGLSPAVRCPAV